jgi:hypothetical protein
MYPEYLKLIFSKDSCLTCLKEVTQGITPEQSEYVTIAQVSHPEPKTLEIGSRAPIQFAKLENTEDPEESK